jgi:hypothetical protein
MQQLYLLIRANLWFSKWFCIPDRPTVPVANSISETYPRTAWVNFGRTTRARIVASSLDKACFD